MPAASVQAFLARRVVGDRAAEQAKPSRAVPASAGPCGPGRRERTRPQPQGDPRARARRPAATAPSKATAVIFAAVEASPAPCRAQRRAGALSAGADVTERSAAEWRNDGDGGLDARRVRARPFAHTPSARPDFTPPDWNEVEGGSRGHDSRAAAGVACAAWIIDAVAYPKPQSLTLSADFRLGF